MASVRRQGIREGAKGDYDTVTRMRKEKRKEVNRPKRSLNDGTDESGPSY